MNETPYKRLLELDAAGFSWSRNRHFARFEDPEMHRLRALRQRLEQLVHFVKRYAEAPDLELRLQEDGQEHCVLHVEVAHLALACRFRLHRHEFDWLRTQHTFEEVWSQFAQAGGLPQEGLA